MKKPDKSHDSGFTLLEILVVVVILGIVTVFATARLMATDEEKLQQESEKLLATLEKARDESAFGGRVIAVELNAGDVKILERDIADPSRWQLTSIDGLTSRQLPDGFSGRLLSLKSSANSTSENRTLDYPIVFLPIGVAMPFDIEISSSAGSRFIHGDAIGNMKLAKT